MMIYDHGDHLITPIKLNEGRKTPVDQNNKDATTMVMATATSRYSATSKSHSEWWIKSVVQVVSITLSMSATILASL